MHALIFPSIANRALAGISGVLPGPFYLINKNFDKFIRSTCYQENKCARFLTNAICRKNKTR